MDIFDDPAAAPIDPQQALIEWKPDEVKQLFGMLHGPQTQLRPQAPPPQAPPLPSSDSMDWRELIRQMGPAIGLLAVHGNGTTNAAALAGWEHGKNIALQEQQARKDEARQKLEKGSQLLNDVASHVSQFDNLTDYDNYIKSAEPPLVSLGIVQPGELRDRFPFDLPGARRKEVTAQLDQLEKNGYNLDQISGGHLTLKDGTTVPIGAALQALRRRPLDANNKAIPVPVKADSAPSTELDRQLARYARENGYASVNDIPSDEVVQVKREWEGKQDKTAPVGSDFNQFLTRWAKEHGNKTPDQITATEEVQARKDFRAADSELADLNKSLTQLRVDAAEAKAKQGPGGLSPDSIQFEGTKYRITGKMSALGMGNAEARSAIINEAARQTKELGQAPAIAIQKQAAYVADGAALKKMTSMSAAAESFETKALAQADIVESLSNKVPRMQIPLINGALLRGEKAILGDDNTQLLFNAVSTFTTEYAKIMEGSTGSAAASSDSARKAAAELISPALSNGTLKKTLDLMRREMRLTIEGYDATKAHITERMGGAPAAAPSAPAATTPIPGALAAPPDGRQRVRSPDGKQTGTVPVGTALPPGWTVVQ